MTQAVDQAPTEAPQETDDLVAAIQKVLQASDEPLTVSKIKTALPARFKSANLEDMLHRQVTANVLYQYPKYRSQQDRFWDRPMPVHITCLLHSCLQEKALPWSELRRKLPAYVAPEQAEALLQEQVAQGKLYKHPRTTSRGGDPFGVAPADARTYLNPELSAVFHRLEEVGFTRAQLRQGALELLHDEEWGPTPPEAKAPRKAKEAPSGEETAGQATHEAPTASDNPS